MNYSKEDHRKSSGVSVNTLIQPKKNHSIGDFPSYATQEQKRQVTETGKPLSALLPTEEIQTVQAKFSGDSPGAPQTSSLPDSIKTGLEDLSGLSMDDVRVHYNSPQPAQVQALAYTQGTDIHIAPGQERHLPHEAWHVVQQAQGRVHPTLQLGDLQVNDNAGLEKEADEMGQIIPANDSQGKAETSNIGESFLLPTKDSANHRAIQRMKITMIGDGKVERFDPQKLSIKELEAKLNFAIAWNDIEAKEFIENEIHYRTHEITDGEFNTNGKFCMKIDDVSKQVLVEVRLHDKNHELKKSESARLSSIIAETWSNKVCFVSKRSGEKYSVITQLRFTNENPHYILTVDKSETARTFVNRNENLFSLEDKVRHGNKTNPAMISTIEEQLIPVITQLARQENWAAKLDGIVAYTEDFCRGVPNSELSFQIKKSRILSNPTFLTYKNILQALKARIAGKDIGCKITEQASVPDDSPATLSTDKEASVSQYTIAHEFGHMIGLGEEYPTEQERLSLSKESIEGVFGESYSLIAAAKDKSKSTIMGEGSIIMRHHFIEVLRAFSKAKEQPITDWGIEWVE